ncbi:membrane protein [Streptomyces kronopolitis]|uniref:Membrane protein n=1 Tax=Streptomyces kronopolitis TaxID=1612435 RepID=A0ABQ2J558_9ACTN|nr:PP2C family protein-serine/threonine phosphatase [Streptomyces kronopolitis]GGN40432.1 membrane protein [Streptomyces kronopolitis]
MDPVSTKLPWYVPLVPSALVAIGTVWNVYYPDDFWGDNVLGAAVVVAGALLSLRHTIAIAAALILVDVPLLYAAGYLDHTIGPLLVFNTFFAALVGIWVNRVLAHHGRRLELVRSVAEVSQRAVLPPPPARIGALAIAAVYNAAQVEALIGGDAYAVRDTPRGARFLIGDVRGKGLDAVSAVSVLLGAFREAADQEPDLVALTARLERALIKEASLRDETVRLEGFVTAVVGEIPPDSACVRLLNCGHPAPYLLDGNAVVALETKDPGLPLGMSVLGGPEATLQEWPFPVGGTLLLVTDGVTEARNHAGTFYDPGTRLRGKGPFAQPAEAITALVRDVERWTGGPRDDDMAILALTRSADRGVPGRTPR